MSNPFLILLFARPNPPARARSTARSGPMSRPTPGRFDQRQARRPATGACARNAKPGRPKIAHHPAASELRAVIHRDLMSMVHSAGMILDYEKILEVGYRRFLKASDVVVDVGAHIGTHLRNFVEIVGPRGRVFGFEPLPTCFETLKSLELTSYVGLDNVALSDTSGEVDFVFAQGAPWESGLKQRIYNSPETANPTCIRVKSEKLDNVLRNISRLGYIKIDAEGGEILILNGSESLLDRLRPVPSVEYGHSSYSAYGNDSSTLFHLAVRHAYVVCDLFGAPIETRETWENICDRVYWDWFLVPREKVHAWSALMRCCVIAGAAKSAKSPICAHAGSDLRRSAKPVQSRRGPNKPRLCLGFHRRQQILNIAQSVCPNRGITALLPIGAIAAVTNQPDVDLDTLMRRIRAELSPRDVDASVALPPASVAAPTPATSPTPAPSPAPEASPTPAASPTSFFGRLKVNRRIRSVIAFGQGIPAVRKLPELRKRAEKTEVRLTEFTDALNSRMADVERDARTQRQALVDQATVLNRMAAQVVKIAQVEQLEARLTKMLTTAFGKLEQLQGHIEELESRVARTIAAGMTAQIDQLTIQMNTELSQVRTIAAGMTASVLDEVEKRLTEFAPHGQIEQLTMQLETELSQVRTIAAGMTASVLDEVEKRLTEFAPHSQIEQLATEMSTELSQLRIKLTDQWRDAVNQRLRLGFLLVEARRRLPEAFDQSQLALVVGEQDHALDAFYVSFEDRWRGTRADIKNRQSVYLPCIKVAAEATGGAPVVDVGCGRGEWLELLKENGIAGKGYDLNRIMIMECQERGLDATLGDALDAIRAMPDESVAAITGFHIIEHIPFATFAEILDESLRVLRPHGLIVFETPNPSNWQVASERFYYDPTHRNPLPSELVAFLTEARGFSRIEVRPLHPMDPLVPRMYSDPMLELLRQKLFGPQDYGIVGWKDR